MLSGAARSALEALLEEARQRGLLGPAPIDRHVDHALALVECIGEPPRRLLDLGSGAGVPGIVLALSWPDTDVWLLEAQARRAAWLRTACQRLSLSRTEVLEGRAEALAHDPRFREAADVVVARAFGTPAATAECGSGFLAPGGVLVVSEPPDESADRWPAAPLAELALEVDGRCRTPAAHAIRLRKTAPLGAQFPRRVGVPRKRPLWPSSVPAG